MDNFGPLVVPQKGMKIKLNQRNYALYKKAANLLDGAALSKTKDGYRVNGIPAGWYRFKSDYYFMIGDYRTVSFDSRYWGLLPEERIIGKASLVLLSINNGKIKWERFMKKIE